MIKAYADLGGDLALLLSLLDKAHVTSREAAPPDLDALLADPRTDPGILRRGYAIESIDDTYVLGPHRQGVRNIHRLRIHPLSPATRFFPFRHAHEDDLRRGVSTVDAGAGCAVRIFDEAETGAIYVVLEFDATDHDAYGACELEWSVQFHTDVAARPRVLSGTKTRMARATTRVRFAEPALPSMIWWFRSFDPSEAAMRPPPDRIISPTPEPVYAKELFDLAEEWWGLAWSWSASDRAITPLPP